MTGNEGQPLTVRVETLGSATVLVLQGSADAADLGPLRDHVEQLLAARTPLIVLDLTGVDFIGSPGLGLLVSSHRRARDYRGDLRLVSPSARVLDVLETTRLTTVLGVYSSVDQAVNAEVPEV